MNTRKIIILFCASSIFPGLVYGRVSLLTETPESAITPEIATEQKQRNILEKGNPVQELQVTPSQPLVAQPEMQEQQEIVPASEMQGPAVVSSEPEPQAEQAAVENVAPVQPVVEIPSAPITRVIAPGQALPKDVQKTEIKTPETLQDIKMQPQTAYSYEQQKDDEQALEELAVRSQEVKKHLHILPPDDGDERIEFQFENTDLAKVIQQVGDLFNVTFIPDDIIINAPQTAGLVPTAGHKVSFRTQKSMTKKQAWNLFLNFLDIAGFNVVPEKSPRRYRIIATQKALKSPVPSYIGVDPQTLPDNDQMIRYVYFVENGNMNVILSVVNKLCSNTSDMVPLNDAKAFILTDKAYNIKTLMVIVKELDRVSMPQAMSVMKLRSADAKDVKSLFDQLMGLEEGKQPTMFMPPRQQPTAFYFPANTRLIAETRTNSLIILGTPDAIEKIESFIRKNVDKEPDMPHSPLFYYDLKFADATTVQTILETTVTEFGKGTEAAKVGGIRGTDKYVKRMSFIADPATNRIIMRGDYQDYLMVKDLIYEIDQPQPQVAIEILVLYVSWSKVKQLGTQIRNYMKTCGGFGSDRVQFQTSGLNGTSGIVEREKTEKAPTLPNRLMGNLLNLVTGLEAGNTIISLGRDIFGVWGILQVFESFTASETVANPFLMAANKQEAVVNVGETRRVVTSQIIQSETYSTDSYDDMTASLDVKVTPQINSDGMITLDILVSLKTFMSGFTAQTAGYNTRKIETKAIVSDREVLALGGLLQNKSTKDVSKVPGLGDVPILGWLFKNEGKEDQRDCFLILFSTQIIDPLVPDAARRFTQHHIDDYYGTIDATKLAGEKHDPVYRMFFEEDKKSVGNRVQDFIFDKPKKRTKKEQQQLDAIKKEHPVLADQPDVLEAMYGTSVSAKKDVLIPDMPNAVAPKKQKADKKRNANTRRRASLTGDTLANQEVSA